jgi:hypothetical protein
VNLAVLLIIIAVMIILGGLNAISWWEVVPLIIAFCGCWYIIFAGIGFYQTKYTSSVFNTFGWGMILAAIGFGWYLNVRGLSWVFTVAVVILLLGILGLVAAIRNPRKKPASISA